MIKWIRLLKERIIINRYVYHGLIVGDIYSYGAQTGCWNTGIHEVALSFWEYQYKKLGYVPITNRHWQLAGGYGADHKQLLKIENDFDYPQHDI